MVFDLAGLLRHLTERGVRFVVIGGVAVAAHEIVRATEDVDIVPDPDHDNLEALANCLAALDARLIAEPSRGIDPEIRLALRQGRNISVTTDLGDVDVVQRLPGIPSYTELETDAWDADVFGVRFRVCSRAHLVQMKRARSAPRDLSDLERLG